MEVEVVVRWLAVVTLGVVLKGVVVGVAEDTSCRLPQRHKMVPSPATGRPHSVGLPHIVRLPSTLPFHARCMTARMLLWVRSRLLVRSPSNVSGDNDFTWLLERLSVVRSSPSKDPGSNNDIALFCSNSDVACGVGRGVRG